MDITRSVATSGSHVPLVSSPWEGRGDSLELRDNDDIFLTRDLVFK